MNKNFISKVLALAFAFFPLMTLAQTTHNVSAGSYYYTDIYETVYEGDQVCWFNDGGYHDVNFSGYGNPQEIVDQYLPPNSGGDLGCVTFNSAGSFTYDCSIGNHAANGMVATISVVENNNSDLVSSVAHVSEVRLGASLTGSFSVRNRRSLSRRVSFLLSQFRLIQLHLTAADSRSSCLVFFVGTASIIHGQNPHKKQDPAGRFILLPF